MRDRLCLSKPWRLTAKLLIEITGELCLPRSDQSPASVATLQTLQALQTLQSQHQTRLALLFLELSKQVLELCTNVHAALFPITHIYQLFSGFVAVS